MKKLEGRMLVRNVGRLSLQKIDAEAKAEAPKGVVANLEANQNPEIAENVIIATKRVIEREIVEY